MGDRLNHLEPKGSEDQDADAQQMAHSTDRNAERGDHLSEIATRRTSRLGTESSFYRFGPRVGANNKNQLISTD